MSYLCEAEKYSLQGSIIATEWGEVNGRGLQGRMAVESGLPARSTAPKRIRKTKRPRHCSSHMSAYSFISHEDVGVLDGMEKDVVIPEQLYDPASSSTPLQTLHYNPHNLIQQRVTHKTHFQVEIAHLMDSNYVFCLFCKYLSGNS